MTQQEINQLVEEVRELIQYPEVEGETTLEDWIAEGDIDGMTAEEIAAEWDQLSVRAEKTK